MLPSAVVGEGACVTGSGEPVGLGEVCLPVQAVNESAAAIKAAAAAKTSFFMICHPGPGIAGPSFLRQIKRDAASKNGRFRIISYDNSLSRPQKKVNGFLFFFQKKKMPYPPLKK